MRWITLETVLGALMIAGGILTSAFIDSPATYRIEFWQTFTWTGIGLLGIGLVRDIWLIIKARRAGKSARPERAADEKPICVESLLGSILVLAGLLFLGLDVHRTFEPGWPGILLFLGFLFVVSGLIKDLVVVFKVEKDHGNVILW